jgi:hypothetical protein
LFLTLLQFSICPQGELSFPDLDVQLQQIWENIVKKAAGDDISVKINRLQFTWDMVRERMLGGMSGTSYARYVKWYGGRKRQLERDEGEHEPTVRTNSVHGSATARKRSAREVARK